LIVGVKAGHKGQFYFMYAFGHACWLARVRSSVIIG
jgi:hypothetical protein